MSGVAVVVGVLRRGDGRLLVATRDPGRHQGGRLEFPGGKLEPGEPAEAALARELAEEIGIEVVAQRPLIRVRHSYPECTVELDVRLVGQWRGEPSGREGQALSWLAPEELRPSDFPAANRPIVASLAWPARMLVTPSLSSTVALVAMIDRACAAAPHFIQLRAPGVDPAGFAGLVDAATDALRSRADSRLLLNGAPADLVRLSGADGWHLPAREVAALVQRPLAAGSLLSCACHDEAELRRAERLHADLAVIGPVWPTPSHPGRPGIGWDRLAELAARTALPVYAIGGLAPADLDTARAHGAVGVAGIRGFT